MPEVSTTMVTTTTPPVTVASSGMSSLSSVTVAPSLMGLPTMLCQHDVVLSPPLTLRCSGGVLGLAPVPQWQPSSSVPLQAYANYAMGSPQVGFFFRVEPSTILYYYMFDVCSGVYFLLSGALLDAIFTPGGSTIGVCTPATPWSLPVAGICATWSWLLAHTKYAQSGCSLHYMSRGEPFATQSAVPQPSHLYPGAYSFGGLAESQLIPPPSLHGGEGSSFPGLVPSNDMVNSESAMSIKPGDSGVVIGYQVDEFTPTWYAEQFVAHSHFILGSLVSCHH